MENILIKYLSFGLKKKSGHNNKGRITVFNLGGGHKRRYRIIDYKRNYFGILGNVVSINYDPNRTARVALVAYSDGCLSYILAPEGLSVGDKIISSDSTSNKVGNSNLLKYLPTGSIVHNLEIFPGKGGQIARAAGTSALILRKYSKNYIVVKLPSGIERIFNKNCRSVLGIVSNAQQKFLKKSKAGNNRWLGKRPCVRGVAMNPVDHPHGGGEGKKSGKRLTPWGHHIDRKLKKKKNNFIISKK